MSVSDNPSEVAWAAGLFEGEGYAGTYEYKQDDKFRRGGLKRRSLVLSMTDEDVVRRFHAVVGCGKVTAHPPRKAHWKPSWRWDCGRWPDIKDVLEAFLPYLGERRGARAREMLADPAAPHGGPQLTHCKEGHEFTPENVYLWVNSQGRTVRQCRACNRRRDQEARARRRRTAETG